MSRQRASARPPVAKRLRFLRGEDTQEAFAKRVGLSRSAIANYETGRSYPDDFTLSKIVEKLELSPDFFSAPFDVQAEKSFQAVLGQGIEGFPDWTEDEATVVRIIRLCTEDKIRHILGVITESAMDTELVISLGKVFAVRDDIQRLLDLSEGERPYQKGSLKSYADDHPLHHLGFKRKPRLPK